MIRNEDNLKIRKNHLRLVATFLLLPALLILIHWASHEKTTKWSSSLLTVGTSLIIFGCLEIIIFEMTNKNIGAINVAGIILNGFGGILCLFGAIRVSENLCDFGLNSLIAFDALILTIDCSTNIFFAPPLCLSLWLCPLTFSSWFIFGYMLYDNNNNNNLKWWELTGEIGFGIIAISTLLAFTLLCTNNIVKPIINFLIFCTWFACIIIWIYFGVYIANHVDTAIRACFFIAVPFLIFGQTNLLLKIGVLDKNEALYRENVIQLENLIISE